VTLAPAMREFGSAPEAVQAAARKLAATPDRLEYAVCALHLERARAAAPLLSPNWHRPASAPWSAN
jgi:hypothetical protein